MATSKTLKAFLVEQFPRLIPIGYSGLSVYRASLPLEQIARGMAAAIKRPAIVIRLQSEDLQRGEAWQLLRPLLHGETLVLVYEESSSIGENLAAYWPKFVRNLKSYAAPVEKGLMLDHRLTIESPGSVVALQRKSPSLSSYEITEWQLADHDALELTALAASWSGDVVTIGGTPSARLMIRDNEEAYRAYRQLVKDIQLARYNRTVAEGIGARAIRGEDGMELELAFRADHVDLQLYETLYYRLTALSEHCGKIRGGLREDEALPDVYAAAIIVSKAWSADPKHEVVYRGQRNSAWPLVPSYFRPDKDGMPPDLDTREKRLRRFAGLLAGDYPELDESQCLAVAQHVSSEAKTPTWLIDVTWDPLIALYFASTDGQTDDLGIVDRVVIPEWRTHVAGVEDLPGGFMAVGVPVIERVRRQRGLFLNAPRGGPLRALCTASPVVQTAIRRSLHRLYRRSADRRCLASAAPRCTSTNSSRRSTIPRSKCSRRPASCCRRIRLRPSRQRRSSTRSCIGRDVSALDSFHRFVLDVIAELFANPQEWTDSKDSSKFGVHRFSQAIRWAFERAGRPCFTK